jgi:hypothetical protein
MGGISAAKRLHRRRGDHREKQEENGRKRCQPIEMPIEQALNNFDIRGLILTIATNRGAKIRHLILLCAIADRGK